MMLQMTVQSHLCRRLTLLVTFWYGQVEGTKVLASPPLNTHDQEWPWMLRYTEILHNHACACRYVPV